MVALLNYAIDRATRSEVPHTAEAGHPEAHDDIDELSHIDHYNQHAAAHDPKRDLWVAGVVIGCAIALHNIPEGMSIGASYAIGTSGAESSALILAVLIGIHNIPEGMAVALPLIAGGMGRLKAGCSPRPSCLPPSAGERGLGLLGGQHPAPGGPELLARGSHRGAIHLCGGSRNIPPSRGLMSAPRVPAFLH